jgi:hypothetical protein
MNNKTFAIALIIIAFIFGVIISPIVMPITTASFYSELRKRALSSSDFICNEAKQAKFLYEKYELKGN